jgi:hypothetical protein
VEACFTFGHQLKPILSVWTIRDKTRKHGSLSHLALLRTFPAIGVAQHNFRTIFDGIPKLNTTCMRGFNVISGALE